MTFCLVAGRGAQQVPVTFPVPSHELGSIELSPTGEFEAGSYQTFILTYTAGKFGIDDSGSMRVCFRFASDRPGLSLKIRLDRITLLLPHLTARC